MEKSREKRIKEKNKNLIINIIIIILVGFFVYFILYLLIFDPRQTRYSVNEDLYVSYNLEKDLIPDPVQHNIQKEKFTEKVRGIDIEITKLASYDITGKVEAIQDYGTNFLSGLLSFKGSNVIDYISPRDLTLSWGKIALNENSRHVYANQYYMNDNRVVWLSWDKELKEKYSEDYIVSHISNDHIITLNKGLRNELSKVRVGQIVRMQGYLVSVKASNGITWGPSSLSRSDTGNGACEILYLEDFLIMKKERK